MKLHHRFLAACLAGLLCLGWPGGGLSALAAPEEGAQRYIVQLSQDVVMPLAARSGGVVPISHTEDYYMVEGAEQLQVLTEAGLVTYAVPDVTLELLDAPLTNDPGLVLQWYVGSLGVEDAWEAGLNGDGIKVAVIDSGLYADHEDLAPAKLLAESRNFLGEGDDHDPDAWGDDLGHGSLVSGILAAQADNGIGIAGLSGQVEVLTLRCFSNYSGRVENKNSGSLSVLLSAVGYAMEQDVDIIVMSFGGDKKEQLAPLEAQLERAAEQGILLVAAVGNSGNSTLLYPAAYDCVIGVGNTNSSGGINSTSQRNSSVFVTAPGTLIYGLGYKPGALYRTDGGTSFSAPMVAALGALVKQADAGIDQDGFKSLLMASAVDAGAPGYDILYGYGIVSASNLMEELKRERSITYELNGGALSGTPGVDWPDSYTILRSADVTLPTAPTKEYCTFAGWYTDSSLREGLVTQVPSGSVEALTFYAGWEEAEIAAEVERVTVLGVEAEADGGENFVATLPFGTDLSALTALDFGITAKDARAALTGPETQDGGVTWTFQVEATEYTISLTVSTVAAPVLLHGQGSQTGAATPSSYDGVTTAVRYTEDVGGWFMGAGALRYEVILGHGSGMAEMTGSTLAYTPAIADAGQTATLFVYASNEGGESARATVQISVAAIPVSNATLGRASVSYDIHAESGGVAVDLNLYGNHLVSIHRGPTQLTEGTDYLLAEAPMLEGDSRQCTIQHSYLKNLSPGSHSLTFTFSGGRNEEAKTVALSLTVSNSKPIEQGGGGLGGGGGAAAPTAALSAPGSSNVKFSYTLSGEGAAVLTLDQDTLKGLAAAGSGAVVDLSGLSGCISATLEEGELSIVKEKGITLLLPQVGIVLEGAALEDLLAQAKGKQIVFSARIISAQEAMAKGRLAFEITMTAGGKAVKTLQEGAVLMVSHQLRQGENATGVGLSLLEEGLAPLEAQWDASLSMVTAPITQMTGYLLTYQQVWENLFADVAANDWFYEAVEYAVTRGLFTGVTENAFQPKASMTRAMLVTVLYRLEGVRWQGSETPFSDVVPDAWYAPAVNWAAAQGIVTGMGAKFHPGEALTREQLVVILYRYSGEKAIGDISSYPDGVKVSAWAVEGMAWATQHGFLQGKEDGALDPGGEATRAEVAAILQRLLEAENQ